MNLFGWAFDPGFISDNNIARLFLFSFARVKHTRIGWKLLGLRFSSHPIIFPFLLFIPVTILGCSVSDIAPNEVQVDISEVRFYVDIDGLHGPTSTPAGWTRILLENRGERDNHMGLVKLNNGNTAADLRTAVVGSSVGQLPQWAIQSGGPGDIAPGLTAAVIQNLREGSYALLQYIVDEKQISRVGVQTFRPFTVTSPSSYLAPEPETDLMIDIVDYGYKISDGKHIGLSAGRPIKSGSRLAKVTNKTARFHELRVSRIRDGKRAIDFPEMYGKKKSSSGRGSAGNKTESPSGQSEVIRSVYPVVNEDGLGPGGPPPGTSVGGVLAIAPGEVVYVTLELNPAFYFVYDLSEDEEMSTSYLLRPMLLEFPVQ